MIKILLACSAGMSTSLLEKSMRDEAAKRGLECLIEAHPSFEAKQILQDWDVTLLGPQIRFELAAFKSIAKGKPLDVIPPQIYALAKGAETLDLALKLLK